MAARTSEGMQLALVSLSPGVVSHNTRIPAVFVRCLMKILEEKR